MLLLACLALLLYGVSPRLAPLAWLGLLFCVVAMMFGEVLRFPDWVLQVSPFEHLALVPAVPVDWRAALVVLAVAAALGTTGGLAFLRRDVR